MTFRSKLKSNHRLLKSGAFLGLLATLPAQACGPIFPNSYLAATESELLAAPEAYFSREIRRLITDLHPAQVAKLDVDAVAVDLADLRRALESSGIPQARQDAALKAYAAFRAGISVSNIKLPGDVPAEFALYAQGAAAWKIKDDASARQAWQQLLDLPADQRRFRSTWAAFMLGKLALDSTAPTHTDPQESHRAQAVRRFRQTRALAGEGCADSLGLAAASYGWEARAALLAGDYPEAISLYLTQAATGDTSAYDSLRITAKTALEYAYEDDDLRPLAHDPKVRLVITGYLLGYARYDYDNSLPDISRRWTHLLQSHGAADLPGADRLAWIAYENGLFQLAADWARLAPATSPETHWIRAKLALRSGSLETGEKALRATLAAGELAPEHRRLVLAELGRVCLALDHNTDALEAWTRGGHLEDAAYLAERIMTATELRAYVDAHCPDVKPANEDAHGWLVATEPETRRALRSLLARRLSREGRFDEATPYYPIDLQPVHTACVDAIRTGYDTARSDSDRAAAFWRAAQTLRDQGMELIGTELDPDWAIWGGDFTSDAEATRRLGTPRLEGGQFAPTAMETERLAGQKIPSQRFHYRYRAADLAWWAAALLPNNSDHTAEILDTAGRWLAVRDPAAANRFYQALVIRCGHTRLGHAAAEAHWFPHLAAND